jgi:hypothetical protein
VASACAQINIAAQQSIRSICTSNPIDLVEFSAPSRGHSPSLPGRAQPVAPSSAAEGGKIKPQAHLRAAKRPSWTKTSNGSAAPSRVTVWSRTHGERTEAWAILHVGAPGLG